MSIALMQPKLPNYEDLAPYLKKIDESRMYSNFGPLNEELISRLADYFGVEESHVNTVSNATQGITGALQVLSEISSVSWELPSWTFTATAIALKHAGFGGTFRDIDNDWRVKPTSTAQGIIDVLPFGESVRSAPLPSQKMFKIIDGAASFDALKDVGSSLDENTILIVSMHATKLLAGGEGGIVITKNPLWSKMFKSWTNYGFDGSRVSINLGTNAKISEYTAAIALASLDQWDAVREKILANSQIAIGISQKLGFGINGSLRKGFATPYWILDCDSQNQKLRVVDEFAKKSIATRDWWESGCHKMPAFSDFKKGNLDETEKIASKTIGVPFHFFMNEDSFELIHETLAKVV
jgi:dTDP-4-amino-4,6-dideoxygalactose transaminase